MCVPNTSEWAESLSERSGSRLAPPITAARLCEVCPSSVLVTLTAAVNMERDCTVRRSKAFQNHQNPQDGPSELNGLEAAGRKRKQKPEVSAQLLSEGTGGLLVLGFVCLLWVLVLISLQQLVITSSGEFNAVRAR